MTEGSVKKNKESVCKQRFRSRYLNADFAAGVGYKIIRGVILTGLCFLIIYPFLLKAINSFKSFEDFLDPSVFFIPKHFSTEILSTAMSRMDYWKSVLVTATVCLGVAVIETFVSAMVGYGFARFKFKGNSLLFFFVILTLIIPPQTIIIPLFTKFQSFLGFIPLLNTVFPVFILAIGCLGLKNGLFVFMFRQHYRGMPIELEEAAYIDGYGTWKTFLYIMLPSGTAIMSTVFLLSFSWQWTDMLYNNLFLKDVPMLANTVMLASSLTTGDQPVIREALANTGALLAVAPLAALYLVAQRFFIQGVERSGLVG